MHLECGDSCRFALSNCYTSSRHLQRKNLPVCKLLQWHPCGATQTSTRSCSIQLVCMKVGRESCSQNMGINVGQQFAPSHCYTSCRQFQLQRTNLQAYCDTWNSCDATQTSRLVAPILPVCTKVGGNSCSQNTGINAGSQFAPSHCYTSQAGNYNEATYQYRRYDNAIHVVQRKHQHLFLQHHWFTARLGENTCSQNMGMNAGSHHLLF